MLKGKDGFNQIRVETEGSVAFHRSKLLSFLFWFFPWIGGYTDEASFTGHNDTARRWREREVRVRSYDVVAYTYGDAWRYEVNSVVSE